MKEKPLKKRENFYFHEFAQKKGPKCEKCTKMPQNGLKTVLWVNFLLLKARKIFSGPQMANKLHLNSLKIVLGCLRPPFEGFWGAWKGLRTMDLEQEGFWYAHREGGG